MSAAPVMHSASASACACGVCALESSSSCTQIREGLEKLHASDKGALQPVLLELKVLI